MITQEIGSTWAGVGLVVASSSLMLIGLIALVRINGLRSFSKMSSFDFAVTVAFGSLLAGVAVSGSSLVDGLIAAATLLGLQAAISMARSRFSSGRVVDNQPLLLMAGGEMLEANMRSARVTGDDVRAKLRAANVHSYADVQAVVLETTGDISVIHGAESIEPDLLRDVRDADAAFR
ncbi:MAG: DUF421 domain-containing protein [Iamia sp.]